MRIRTVIRDFVFAASLALGAMLNSALAEEWLVITDIDDTIRDTRVGRAGITLDTSLRTLDSRNALTGASELLFAASPKASIVYLTAMPREISFLATPFLRSFPPGEVYFRRNHGVSSSEHKFEQVMKLAHEHPHARIILIGDNGENDPTIYHRLQNEPSLKKRIEHVFIRRAYPDRAIPAGAHQTHFFTWAELAIGFQAENLINEKDAEAVIEEVSRTLSLPEARDSDSAFKPRPGHDPSTAEDVFDPIVSRIRKDSKIDQAYKRYQSALIRKMVYPGKTFCLELLLGALPF